MTEQNIQMPYFLGANAEFSNKFELEGKTPDWKDLHFTASAFMLGEELQELKEALNGEDIAETLEAFADISVLALNGVYKTLRTMGYNHVRSLLASEIVMDRVVYSNMSKLHGEEQLVVRDSVTGKMVKPDDWVAPSFDDIIKMAEK